MAHPLPKAKFFADDLAWFGKYSIADTAQRYFNIFHPIRASVFRYFDGQYQRAAKIWEVLTIAFLN